MLRVLLSSFLLVLTASEDADALTISGQLGDGDRTHSITFSFGGTGSVRLANGPIRPLNNYVPGQYTLFPSPGTSCQLSNPASDPTSDGSGSATFLYENTLTLNGVTQAFSRQIDVTWGPQGVVGARAHLHRAVMVFDFGADGVYEVEYPDFTLGNNSTPTATTLTSVRAAMVPEPSTALLVILGLLGLKQGRSRGLSRTGA